MAPPPFSPVLRSTPTPQARAGRPSEWSRTPCIARKLCKISYAYGRGEATEQKCFAFPNTLMNGCFAPTTIGKYPFAPVLRSTPAPQARAGRPRERSRSPCMVPQGHRVIRRPCKLNILHMVGAKQPNKNVLPLPI